MDQNWSKWLRNVEETKFCDRVPTEVLYKENVPFIPD